MNTTKRLSIILLCIGAIGLIYGNIHQTTEIKTLDESSLKTHVMSDEHINFPVVLGIGCLLFGSLLFALRNKL
ncbi:hypothetical protein [Cellvibrio sp. UBA7661]|uniref:hypothetical protein n=1 Tax=Cellvibrio sp. UBA7661 TaxID=1946311 RepID=UPI002F35973F